jgi:hypothetical protein
MDDYQDPAILSRIQARNRAEQAAAPRVPPPTIPDADGEQPLPPTPAREAQPYLRKLFAIINDPKIEGRARTAEYYVPKHLRDFCVAYLDGKDYRCRFFVGPLTGKAYVTIAPKDEK